MIRSVLERNNIANVAFFIDNNLDILINDLPIYNPESITSKHTKFFVFICAADLNAKDEMAGFLMQAGFIKNIDFMDASVLQRYFCGTPLYPYECVVTDSSYAPWRFDENFYKIYGLVKNNSLCDLYRLYKLWSLVEEAMKLSDGIMLEVGSWRGGSGGLIAKKAEAYDSNIEVYLCDTFQGVVKAGESDTVYKGGEHADTSIDIVRDLLRKLKLNNVKILAGVFPEETSYAIKDKSIRFCHIDVDVYQSVKDIFEFVWPNLVKGGIVVFDDYGGSCTPGVLKFVRKLRQDKDKLLIEDLTGQGIIIKIG